MPVLCACVLFPQTQDNLRGRDIVSPNGPNLLRCSLLCARLLLCVCLLLCAQTPTMTVPILPGCDPAAAKLLTSRMRRLKLAETLKGIKVGCAVHCCCRWGCHSTLCAGGWRVSRVGHRPCWRQSSI